MNERTVIMLAAAMATTVAGCGAGATAVEGEMANVTEPAGIHIEGLGGIAALRQVFHVDSATGAAFYTMGPLCAPGTQCPANDSVNGVIERASVDAYFGFAATPPFRALRADYGTTPQGADMRGYVVTIIANKRARTIRGDDGSIPPLLSEFMTNVERAVLTAVGR